MKENMIYCPLCLKSGFIKHRKTALLKDKVISPICITVTLKDYLDKVVTPPPQIYRFFAAALSKKSCG
jgi:hypothetical protein